MTDCPCVDNEHSPGGLRASERSFDTFKEKKIQYTSKECGVSEAGLLAKSMKPGRN